MSSINNGPWSYSYDEYSQASWQSYNNSTRWPCKRLHVDAIDDYRWCYVINPFASYMRSHIVVDISSADNSCNRQETWIILPFTGTVTQYQSYGGYPEIPQNVNFVLPIGWRVRITNFHVSDWDRGSAVRVSTIGFGSHVEKIVDSHRDTNEWIDMEDAQGSEEFVWLGNYWYAMHDLQ